MIRFGHFYGQSDFTITLFFWLVTLWTSTALWILRFFWLAKKIEWGFNILFLKVNKSKFLSYPKNYMLGSSKRYTNLSPFYRVSPREKTWNWNSGIRSNSGNGRCLRVQSTIEKQHYRIVTKVSPRLFQKSKALVWFCIILTQKDKPHFFLDFYLSC